ncbi:MAG: permease prefix domain 2-containing transporter [Pseudomonadota bacterium]
MSRPPVLAWWLVERLAPASRREDLLGDLEECFHACAASQSSRARWRYWGDVLRLAPFLAGLRIEQVGGVRALGWLLLCVPTLLLWEMTLVRATAWPITAQLLALGELPGRLTFFLVYGVITGLGIVVVLGGAHQLAKGRAHSRAWWWMVGSALSLPSLFFAVHPQPLDSVWMRLSVLLALWCAIALMARSPSPQRLLRLPGDR